MRRRTYHHGDLRAALVDHAVEAVERDGAESFSLREAARAVGVTPNAAYRHFADRAQLLSAVAATGFRRLAEQMEGAMERSAGGRSSRERAVERFKATGRAYVEFALAHPRLFRLMFGPAGALAQGTVEPPTPYDVLAEALDALVDHGVLTPERREGAELKAWAVVHGYAALTVEEAPRFTAVDRTALASLLTFVVDGLSREPS